MIIIIIYIYIYIYIAIYIEPVLNHLPGHITLYVAGSQRQILLVAPMQTYVVCGSLLLGATGKIPPHSTTENTIDASAERRPIVKLLLLAACPELQRSLCVIICGVGDMR